MPKPVTEDGQSLTSTAVVPQEFVYIRTRDLQNSEKALCGALVFSLSLLIIVWVSKAAQNKDRYTEVLLSIVVTAAITIALYHLWIGTSFPMPA